MSTGLNCCFCEVEPDKWYYLLEDWNSPKGGWDWREFATAYGPFTKLEQAHEHLHNEHANPGGSLTIPYEEGFKLDKVLEDLVKSAVAPDPSYLELLG
jgi:hypothetical protein